MNKKLLKVATLSVAILCSGFGAYMSSNNANASVSALLLEDVESKADWWETIKSWFANDDKYYSAREDRNYYVVDKDLTVTVIAKTSAQAEAAAKAFIKSAFLTFNASVDSHIGTEWVMNCSWKERVNTHSWYPIESCEDGNNFGKNKKPKIIETHQFNEGSCSHDCYTSENGYVIEDV